MRAVTRLSWIRRSQYLRSAFLSSKANVELLKMPSLSPTMTTGTISKWLVKPGDALNAGDVICEVETDKATVAFELQDGIVLAKVLVDAQTEVAVGQPIALTVEDMDEYQAFLKMDPKDYPVVAAGAKSTAAPVPVPAPAPTAAVAAETAPSSSHTNSSALLSPAARNMVQRGQLDVSKVQGSGKHGMISKSDLIGAMKAGLVSPTAAPVAADNVDVAARASTAVPATCPAAAPPATASHASMESSMDLGSFQDMPNSNMRKVIAKRLTESKTTVPHFYVTMECPVDAVMTLRAEMKKSFDINISVNDVVIKAAALALRDVPEANARWNAATNGVVENHSVDISVAVATPTGLITPIVTQADRRGLVDVNATVKELAGRAKIGKLKPEEYQGGTFSISNLGMFGINGFSAVINPPQACILAVGSGVKKVVPPSTPEGEPEVITTVTVQLSADRRVLDEAIAAQYLQVFRTYFSNPKAMLL